MPFPPVPLSSFRMVAWSANMAPSCVAAVPSTTVSWTAFSAKMRMSFEIQHRLIHRGDPSQALIYTMTRSWTTASQNRREAGCAGNGAPRLARNDDIGVQLYNSSV